MSVKKGSDTLSRIAVFVEEHSLIKRGDRVLVSLSGGPDSTFLLHALVKLKEKFGISALGALHINHGMRGDEGKRDEEFSRELARKLNIPFYLERVDVPAFSREHGVSLEEGGRILRERIYKKYLSAWSKIATGHNLNDQVETLIMRLFKGSGIKGLAGILPERGRIIRPLLCVERAEIVEYLEREKIDYVVDSSNLSKAFLRNRIRLELLPIARSIFGSIKPVSYLAEDARKTWEYLQEEVERKIVPHLLELGKHMLALPVSVAGSLPYPLKLALFYTMAGERMRRQAFLSFKDVLEGRKRGSTAVNTRIEVSRGFIFTFKETPNTGKIPLNEGKVKIGHIEYKVVIDREVRVKDPWKIKVKEEMVKKMALRQWRDGDRVKLKGSKEKKVKKLFQEAKIPPPIRRSLPVVEISERIVWIPPIFKAEGPGEGVMVSILPPEDLLKLLDLLT